MAGETTITITGNLTADPELRHTQNGLAVANFTVASTPRTFDRESNSWKDGDPLFVRCTAWRDYAEHIAKSIAKGTAVVVVGRLVQRTYETKPTDGSDPQKRTVFELEVDEVGATMRYATVAVTKVARPSAQPEQEPMPWGDAA